MAEKPSSALLTFVPGVSGQVKPVGAASKTKRKHLNSRQLVKWSGAVLAGYTPVSGGKKKSFCSGGFVFTEKLLTCSPGMKRLRFSPHYLSLVPALFLMQARCC